jgi:hypothetical protein
MTIHPSDDLLARYVCGDGRLDGAPLWSLESHLESCPGCRARMVPALDPGTVALLDLVHDRLTPLLDTGPAPYRPRPWQRWLRGRPEALAVLPWVVVTIGMLVTALLYDRLYPDAPSLFLLTAPIAPLFSVVAAWSRTTDPAWELVASTARSGLWMLLRRTATVLAVLVPVLATVGWGSGQSPALWLLPCLAFTTATLALGSWIGLQRAAVALTAAWTAGVMVPTLADQKLSNLLQPGSAPSWAVMVLIATALIGLRADSYRRIGSRN